MGRRGERALAADAVRRLRPRPLQEVGAELCNWHGSMGDPVYAVGSFFVSGAHYPDLDVVRRASASLSRNLPAAQAGEHGWGPAEVVELEDLVAFLDAYAEERGAARA